MRSLENVKVEISEEMVTTLSEIVNCDVDELNEELTKIATAATEEYIKMMLGEKVFTRGSDIREYRLYLLILKYFEGNILMKAQFQDYSKLLIQRVSHYYVLH